MGDHLVPESVIRLRQNMQAQDGLAGPFELAEKSILRVLSEIVLDINALRKNDAQVNPDLVDRRHDVPMIRNIFFDYNVQSKFAERFGTDLLLWRSNFIANNKPYGISLGQPLINRLQKNAGMSFSLK